MIVLFVLHLLASAASAQTLAAIQGRVLDVSGAVLSDAVVRVWNPSVGFDISVRTDAEGRYHVFGIPAGIYTVSAEATGFRAGRLEAFSLDVGRTVVRDFRLDVAAVGAEVVVTAEAPLLDQASATLGHVVYAGDHREHPAQRSPFHGSAAAGAGSVAPSQAGFSSRPIRGLGTLAFNTAGNREEAASFIVNGVSTNNLTFGSLIFEPPIGSLDEFKADTSVFAAEYGHVSGAVVNIVTRSGSDQVHGDAFEYFRNDALDARNFFEFTSTKPHPFKRNQFGGSLGGPIWRGRTFYFATYDGVRHRQGVDLNSLVLSDEQRASVTDPVIRQLLPLDPARQRHHVHGNSAVRRFRPGSRRRRSLDGGRPPQLRRPRPSARVHRPPVPGGRGSRPRRETAFPVSAARGIPTRTC